MRVHEFEIGGVRYKMSSLPYGKARSLLFKLQKSVAGGLTSFAKAGSDGAKGDSMAVIVEGFAGILERLDDQLAQEITETLSAHCEFSREGEKWPLVKNDPSHWDDRLGDWFEWTMEGLKHNYSDFLERVLKSIGLARMPSK